MTHVHFDLKPVYSHFGAQVTDKTPPGPYILGQMVIHKFDVTHVDTCIAFIL